MASKQNNNANIIAIVMVAVLAILVIEFGVQTVIVSRLLNSARPFTTTIPINTTTTSSNLSYITISASGTASAVPTISTIDVDVKGMGTSAASAVAMLSSEMNQLNTTVSPYINGNSSNIKTQYINTYNSSGYYSTYNGFIAEQQVEITLPNVNDTNKLITSISAINNTSIYGVSASLSSSQLSALRAPAFSQAMSNATMQAHDIVGNTALTTKNITVNYYNYYPIPYALANSGASINTTNAPPLQYYKGINSVTESITVIFSYASATT